MWVVGCGRGVLVWSPIKTDPAHIRLQLLSCSDFIGQAAASVAHVQITGADEYNEHPTIKQCVQTLNSSLFLFLMMNDRRNVEGSIHWMKKSGVGFGLVDGDAPKIRTRKKKQQHPKRQSVLRFYVVFVS